MLALGVIELGHVQVDTSEELVVAVDLSLDRPGVVLAVLQFSQAHAQHLGRLVDGDDQLLGGLQRVLVQLQERLHAHESVQGR